MRNLVLKWGVSWRERKREREREREREFLEWVEIASLNESLPG